MASSTVAGGGSTVATRAVARRWVRRAQPLWPFVWRGLLPIVGLLLLAIYALWPFAHDEIEASVRSQTRAALAAHGMDWVDVAVSGQQVTLGGTEPSAGAGDAALAVARAAACPSWAGGLTCAVEVSGAFTGPAPAAAAPPAPAAPSAAAACERSLADIVGQTQIEFATGSAALVPQSGAVLDALAKAAAGCDGVIRVEGHTDAEGPADVNRALSEARAAAVVAALVERGFPRARLVAQGFGAERPIADNATAAGRAQNRRIEFRVVADNKN